jgi:hypothetical protein
MIDEFGALVKWYWQGITEVLGETVVHQNPHVDWSEIESGLRGGDGDMIQCVLSTTFYCREGNDKIRQGTLVRACTEICRNNLTFMGLCIVNVFLSMTNKMQRCIILFVIVNALHVSSGFAAYRQELRSVHAASGICQTCLLLPLAWAQSQLIHASGNSKQVWHIPDAACTDMSSWWWAENRSKHVERWQ